MKKLVCLLAACVLLALLPVGACAQGDVSAMISEFPTVQEFKALDADAQLDVYNRTQAAYDAYMALSEEERSAISGAEETFESLFTYFNSQVMPVEEVPTVQENRNEALISGAATLAVVILVLRFFNRKKA